MALLAAISERHFGPNCQIAVALVGQMNADRPSHLQLSILPRKSHLL